MSLIRAEDLHRSYQLGKKTIEVLHGIHLSIEAGERVFLCGPSGAGKTTLMYTLAGLETPQQGRVLIDGEDVYQMGSTKRAHLRNQKMGFIFQNYLLMPELTACENTCLATTIAGKDAMEKAKVLLEKVGLAHRMDHLPGELSGGEQQRVAIARALANDPKIIFADEPTGNLDSKNGHAILDLLFNLAEEGNRTLVIVSHDEHLATLGTRLIRIEDGLLVQ